MTCLGFPSLLAALWAVLLATNAALAADQTVRIATLKFGTVSWELDTIHHNGFDRAHGINLEVSELAGKQAADVMLLGGEADVIVTDWIWVARQRGEGRNYAFVPYSLAVGALLVPGDSTIASLGDLKGKKIAVAGGPTDKSWILLRALAQKRHGFDLARQAEPVFGAPPLLNKKAAQGEFAAIVNFWHFQARLEAKGFRRLVTVSEAAEELGLDPELPLLGYVFHEDWTAAHPGAIEGLAAASSDAKSLLATSDAEWERLRPLMRAEDEATFIALRNGFRAGIPEPGAVSNLESAKAMYRLLAELGGRDLTGSSRELADGVFYRLR